MKEAISLGYRHIDCASAYGNEAEVGAAIREKIQDGTVKRDDLYVVTKVQIIREINACLCCLFLLLA